MESMSGKADIAGHPCRHENPMVTGETFSSQFNAVVVLLLEEAFLSATKTLDSQSLRLLGRTLNFANGSLRMFLSGATTISSLIPGLMDPDCGRNSAYWALLYSACPILRRCPTLHVFAILLPQ